MLRGLRGDRDSVSCSRSIRNQSNAIEATANDYFFAFFFAGLPLGAVFFVFAAVLVETDLAVLNLTAPLFAATTDFLPGFFFVPVATFPAAVTFADLFLPLTTVPASLPVLADFGAVFFVEVPPNAESHPLEYASFVPTLRIVIDFF